MEIQEINAVIRIASVTVLALTGLLLATHGKRGLDKRICLGFVAVIICYLLIDAAIVERNLARWYLLLTGATVVPVFSSADLASSARTPRAPASLRALRAPAPHRPARLMLPSADYRHCILKTSSAVKKIPSHRQPHRIHEV